MSICAVIMLMSYAMDTASSMNNPLWPVFFNKLDSVDVYIHNREKKIAIKKCNPVLDESDTREKFNILMDIAGSYEKFDGDSCLLYYDKALMAARSLGDKSLSYTAAIRKANTLNLLGYFTESAEILKGIISRDLDDKQKLIYFKAKYQLHYLLRYNSINKQYWDKYDVLCELYRDSVLMYEIPESDAYLRNLEKRYCYRGDYDDALVINNQRLSQVESTREEALVRYDRFTLYTRYKGEPIEDWIDDLLLSAIADIESANQDIASLLAVEKYLLAIGEIDYAKQVSDYYYSTMRYYGSRLRRLHGFEHGVIINAQHTEMLSKRQSQISLALIIISILCVASLVLSLVMWRTRRRMEVLNDKLRTSNLASRRYVLAFFQLYSDYIERLLMFRAKINTSTRRGNTNYVLELTNPDKNVNEEELKLLYKNFDAAFLGIFPDYIAGFNELLKPEYRYETLAPDELNMELRIFALIKMGEKDSNTISKLLHCSIKTVYNKRSDIKKKLIGPSSEFEKKLAQL